MNKIVKFLLLSLSAVLFLQSCSLYNDDSETILQNVSIAQKSPTADFSQYRTYAITDSILYISDNEKHRTDNVFVQNILSGISSNMERLGYSKVESSTFRFAYRRFVSSDRNHDLLRPLLLLGLGLLVVGGRLLPILSLLPLPYAYRVYLLLYR